VPVAAATREPTLTSVVAATEREGLLAEVVIEAAQSKVVPTLAPPEVVVAYKLPVAKVGVVAVVGMTKPPVHLMETVLAIFAAMAVAKAKYSFVPEDVVVMVPTGVEPVEVQMVVVAAVIALADNVMPHWLTSATAKP